MECSVRKAFDRTLENRPKLSVPRRASLSSFCAFGSRVPDGSVLMTRAHLLTSFVVVVFLFFLFFFDAAFRFLSLLSTCATAVRVEAFSAWISCLVSASKLHSLILHPVFQANTLVGLDALVAV